MATVPFGFEPPFWLFVALSHLPGILWIWSLASVVHAWRDVSMRGGRAGVAILLVIGFYLCAAIIFGVDFLLLPHHGDPPVD